MDERTWRDFSTAWTARFPDTDIPNLEFIADPGKGKDRLVNALQKCRDDIKKLKTDLAQKEFISAFLWNKIHGVSRQSFKFGGPQFDNVFADDGRTDEEKLELDSPVPVVDFDDTNPTLLLYKNKSRLNDNQSESRALPQHREGSCLSSFGYGAPNNRQAEFGRARGRGEAGPEVGGDGDIRVTSNGSVGKGVVPVNAVCATAESRSGSIKYGTEGQHGGQAGLVRNSVRNAVQKTELKNKSATGWRQGTAGVTNVTSPGTSSHVDSQNSVPSPVVSGWDSAGGGGPPGPGVRYQPKIPLGKTLSEPGQVAFSDRDSSERLSQRHRPPVPAPRPSARGPVFKDSSRSGVPLLSRADSVSSVGSAGSMLDSPGPESSPLTMEKYSNSPSGHRRRQHDYCEIDIASISSKDSFDSSGSAEDGVPGANPETDARKQRQAQRRQQDYVNVTIPSQSSAQGILPPTKDTSTTNITGGGPPMLKRRDKSKSSNTASESCLSVSPRSILDDEEGTLLYDSPLPVNREELEESSSDEDEPIYWNLMQLKQEMINKASLDASAIYASVDLQKKDLERQARRLSQNFIGLPVPAVEVSPPVPKRVTPLIRGSGHKSVKATKSNESERDSVFAVGDEAVSTKEPRKLKGEEGAWKKRGSMLLATQDDGRSVSSLSDEGDQIDSRTQRDAETEKMQMRKWVVTSILDSEHSYVDMLDVLLQYMRSLEAASKSSKPVISPEDIGVIFNKIPDLHRIHSQFIQKLEPAVENWSATSEVAEVFKLLALEEYPIASQYLQNYQKAITYIQRCSDENPQFMELKQAIKCKGSSEVATLEEMLHKPVVRVQRNTLVLHDLIKCTPTSHADYDMLQKTLKITHNFLETFQCPLDAENTEHQRYLVKNGMIVEYVSNRRKLRHFFLFNDVLICAKQKMSRQKLHFELKWLLPLTDMAMESSQSKDDKKMAAAQKDKVEKLKKKVSDFQADLRAELRRNQSHQGDSRQWSIRGGTRNIEKIRKKLGEHEVELVRESPHLSFRLRNKHGKSHTLLMSSDYERNDWRETILGLIGKQSKGTSASNFNSVELQNLLNSIQRSKIIALGALDDIAIQAEHLYGCLSVKVQKVVGLKTRGATLNCIEVDSYGHFFMKAKTKTICDSAEPIWNEEFEIDLDGAQTMRVLAYETSEDGDKLLGRGALELSKDWLKGDYQETSVSLNEELSMIISLKYSSREQTLKRTPSSAKGGLFGVKIASVTKRESRQVPWIVSTCVEEVEKRGMEDLGIYRISGLSSEIQRLKKAFERNVKGAIPLAQETDTHVVACLLKLYFRELPEALFTDKLYPNLVETMTLSDPDAKQRCMLSLLQSLPEPNYTTIVYLLEHLIRVSKSQGKNKMSINNLATVFGPTLLRPAINSDVPMTMDMFSAGARDAMMQTSILQYYLSLRESGVDLRKQTSVL